MLPIFFGDYGHGYMGIRLSKGEIHMAEFASKGVAGSGLGLGIAGTALGLLNGGLGNLLGGFGSGVCSDNMPISRYELEMENKIVGKDSEIAILKSEKYTDEKIIEAYKDITGQLNAFKAEQSAINMQQAVYNATNTSTIACLQGQVAQLQALTKLVVPITSVCPEPMAAKNSWAAPTTGSTPAA